MSWECLPYFDSTVGRTKLAILSDDTIARLVANGSTDNGSIITHGDNIHVTYKALVPNVNDEVTAYLTNENAFKIHNSGSGIYDAVIISFLVPSTLNTYVNYYDYNMFTSCELAMIIDVENEKMYIVRCAYFENTYTFEISSMNTYNMWSWIIGSLPVIYNYEPINYITGNNKTLKLSMIKAESTNHGENVLDADVTDIQRFTDSTDLLAIAKNLSIGEEVNLGYTSDNNYVTLTLDSTSTTSQDTPTYTCTLKYYLRGLHQASLDCTLPPMYEKPNEFWNKYYYSLLLDAEHFACRQSLIESATSQGVPTYYGFNTVENSRGLDSDSVQSLMYTWLASGYHTDTTDPYDYGGNSTPDSGDGQWDNSSENIDIPSIPSVSISDTGFVSVFNPTLSQVKALADYMWAGAFDVSLFKKVMANPMDSIIGFALIPCEPTVSGVDTVKVGNIDTGVSMNAVSNQFVDVDCGTLDLEECWGNYLDYAPYTKITLVLPFIGSVHLSPDDCMKKKIGIKYRIDILSGGCVAYVTCNGSVMYQFTGSCSAQLPITNLDYRGMISALISIGTTAVGVGSAIASGGITAPMVAVGVGNTANNVMNGKPNIQHGGSLGSTSGFLGTRIPYLIITRPRQCVPAGVNKFKGLPSLITSKLKNVTGFTQVHDIHLDELPCSDAEKTELRSILESGVII